MADKVGICLYGHIRSWESCKNSFLNMIYNGLQTPDVFVHTYDVKNTSSVIKYTDDDVKQMLADLNVKTCVVEKADDIYLDVFNKSQQYLNVDHEYHDPQHTYKVYSELRKIYLCYQLLKQYEKDHNIKYTKIIFTRFDLSYDTQLDISTVVDETKLYNFYSGSPEPCDECVVLLPKMADLFAISRFEALDIIGTQHTFMGACPLCTHLMLRYCTIRAGLELWNISTLGTCKRIS